MPSRGHQGRCLEDAYEVEESLGRGAFGVVVRARRKSDGHVCACKSVCISALSEDLRKKALQEAELLRNLDSPFILRYWESFLVGGELHIITQFCDGGTLFDLLRNEPAEESIDEDLVCRISAQIALGMEHLHGRRILHRDIKPANIFMLAGGGVVLGDLGVAKVLLEKTDHAQTFIGSPSYMAPEVVDSQPYGSGSDVWAFGCVSFEMCARRRPFEAVNPPALFAKILACNVSPLPSSYSPEIRGLIASCLRRTPSRRPSASELLRKGPLKEIALSLAAAAAPPKRKTSVASTKHSGQHRARSPDSYGQLAELRLGLPGRRASASASPAAEASAAAGHMPATDNSVASVAAVAVSTLAASASSDATVRLSQRRANRKLAADILGMEVASRRLSACREESPKSSTAQELLAEAHCQGPSESSASSAGGSEGEAPEAQKASPQRSYSVPNMASWCSGQPPGDGGSWRLVAAGSRADSAQALGSLPSGRAAPGRSLGSLLNIIGSSNLASTQVMGNTSAAIAEGNDSSPVCSTDQAEDCYSDAAGIFEAVSKNASCSDTLLTLTDVDSLTFSTTASSLSLSTSNSAWGASAGAWAGRRSELQQGAQEQQCRFAGVNLDDIWESQDEVADPAAGEPVPGTAVGAGIIPEAWLDVSSESPLVSPSGGAMLRRATLPASWWHEDESGEEAAAAGGHFSADEGSATSKVQPVARKASPLASILAELGAANEVDERRVAESHGSKAQLPDRAAQTAAAPLRVRRHTVHGSLKADTEESLAAAFQAALLGHRATSQEPPERVDVQFQRLGGSRFRYRGHRVFCRMDQNGRLVARRGSEFVPIAEFFVYASTTEA